MRYWYYLSDGALFAPEAGQNRAFRDLIASRFGGNYNNFGPPTTQEQVYRQVREYRDRYPGIALVPMENGAGPIPILMGGGTSQSSTRVVPENGATALSTDVIVDKFIADFLAADLMKMKPVDGLTADPKNNWALAGEATDAVLIYSRDGAIITLARSLAHAAYRGTWFDPASGQTGTTVDLSGKAGTTIDKPDSKGWFLLLRAPRS
jgi:hypothetical protein